MLVEGVGDDRAMWVELPGAGSGRARGLAGEGAMLLLAVYAPHARYGVVIRRSFWDERLREWDKLRSIGRYRGWRAMVAGDLNLHFSCLASANRTYEAPLDRYVQAYVEARDGFDCQLLNRANVPTHVSGTVVDVVAIPHRCGGFVQEDPLGALREYDGGWDVQFMTFGRRRMAADILLRRLGVWGSLLARGP